MLDSEAILRKVKVEQEMVAAWKAREKAKVARWGLDLVVFLFAILITIIILLFQEIRLEFVAVVAVLGLSMVWLAGWRRGKQLYRLFYTDELSRLSAELNIVLDEKVSKAVKDALK